MPRPSKHPPLTKSCAIDQIDDIEQLRQVAHRMREAFFAAHSQAAHAIGAMVAGDCAECESYLMNGERDTGCAKWRALQCKVADGFGAI